MWNGLLVWPKHVRFLQNLWIRPCIQVLLYFLVSRYVVYCISWFHVMSCCHIVFPGFMLCHLVILYFLFSCYVMLCNFQSGIVPCHTWYGVDTCILVHNTVCGAIKQLRETREIVRLNRILQHQKFNLGIHVQNTKWVHSNHIFIMCRSESKLQLPYYF